jgi:4-hydroxy-4-methyl-2-oxoglutarate aldolase
MQHATHPDPELAAMVAAYAPYPAATVYEALRTALGRGLSLDPAIHALVPGTRVSGPARTVQTHVGSLRPVLRLVEAARPGEVLVIEAGGSARATAWGGTFSLACALRGVAGCVVNASARDVAEIRALGFPVFALGTSVRGALLDADHGQLDIPVAVGDALIAPGDLIIGDDDGLVVVPRADASGRCRSCAPRWRARPSTSDSCAAGPAWVRRWPMQLMRAFERSRCMGRDSGCSTVVARLAATPTRALTGNLRSHGGRGVGPCKRWRRYRWS